MPYLGPACAVTTTWAVATGTVSVEAVGYELQRCAGDLLEVRAGPEVVIGRQR